MSNKLEAVSETTWDLNSQETISFVEGFNPRNVTPGTVSEVLRGCEQSLRGDEAPQADDPMKRHEKSASLSDSSVDKALPSPNAAQQFELSTVDRFMSASSTVAQPAAPVASFRHVDQISCSSGKQALDTIAFSEQGESVFETAAAETAIYKVHPIDPMKLKRVTALPSLPALRGEILSDEAQFDKVQSAEVKSSEVQAQRPETQPAETSRENGRAIGEQTDPVELVKTYFTLLFGNAEKKYRYLHRLIIILLLIRIKKLKPRNGLLDGLVRFCDANGKDLEDVPDLNSNGSRGVYFRFVSERTGDFGKLWAQFKGFNDGSFKRVTEAINRLFQQQKKSEKNPKFFLPIKSANGKGKPKLMYLLGPDAVKDLKLDIQAVEVDGCVDVDPVGPDPIASDPGPPEKRLKTSNWGTGSASSPASPEASNRKRKRTRSPK